MSLGVRVFLAIMATLMGLVMFLHGTTAEDTAWFSYAFASGSLGGPSLTKACGFLLVFGIPGLLYTIRARFGFGKDESAQ